MSNRLLTGARVWPAIKQAAKGRPRTACVATPYFGKRGASLLPLYVGSRLVVNASEMAVKTGQTCPAALLELHRRGVQVFSHPWLHAKVYVFGPKAFIGSANVSTNSATGLIEAVVQTTDRRTVAHAREFVHDLCKGLLPLGEEQLKNLSALYREPRRLVIRGAAKNRAARGPRTWLAHVSEGDVPEKAEAVYDAGFAEAKNRRTSRRHEVECFWHPYASPYRVGDTVVEVFLTRRGTEMVAPPGTVLRSQGWRRGRRRLTFTYYERLPGRRVELTRLAKALGNGAKKRLQRQGPLADSTFRDDLLAYFTERR